MATPYGECAGDKPLWGVILVTKQHEVRLLVANQYGVYTSD